jgi:hypothetical protein
MMSKIIKAIFFVLLVSVSANIFSSTNEDTCGVLDGGASSCAREAQSGVFTVTFDLAYKTGATAFVGISDVPLRDYQNFKAAIFFTGTGKLLVLKEGSTSKKFCDREFSMVGDSTYSFHFEVDVPNKLYSVYVVLKGNTDSTTIATDYPLPVDVTQYSYCGARKNGGDNCTIYDMTFTNNAEIEGPGSTSICRWKGNRKVAYSFSVDDYPLQTADVPFVLSVTKPLGIRMTWAIITAYMGEGTAHPWDEPTLKSLIDAGHEMCSHSHTHEHTYEMAKKYADNGLPTPSEEVLDQDWREELEKSRDLIEQNIPENGKCLSYIYPGSTTGSLRIRNLVPDYYIAARSVGFGPSFSDYGPSYDPADRGGIFALHNVGAALLQPLDDPAYLNSGGWWNEMVHDVNDRGGAAFPEADFVNRMNTLYCMRDIIWTGTIRDVAQYVYEREASKVEIISSTESSIVLSFTHELNESICDFKFPITLKTEVFSNWSAVDVEQRGIITTVNTVTEGDKQYAYYDAKPNSGNIVISSAESSTTNEIILNESLQLFNYPNPFSGSTRISYNLPVSGHVNLAVYDITGGKVTTLINENKWQGLYNITWSAPILGVYFLRMTIVPEGSKAPILSNKKLISVK